MTEDTGEGTLIDEPRAGTWPASDALVGVIRLSNAHLTVLVMDGGRHAVELAGECAPGDLAINQPYACRAEANHIRWEFQGALTRPPMAGTLRGRQFSHRVVVQSVGQVVAHRVHRT